MIPPGSSLRKVHPPQEVFEAGVGGRGCHLKPKIESGSETQCGLNISEVVGLGAAGAFGKGSGEENRVAPHQTQLLEERKDDRHAERQVDLLPHITPRLSRRVNSQYPTARVLPRSGPLGQ